MKGFKTQLTHQIAEAFINVLTNILNAEYEDDDDKLVMAALDEVRIRLMKKVINYQSQYTITFTPAQAIALRILYVHFTPPETTQFSNRLHMIANEVHQFYYS